MKFYKSAMLVAAMLLGFSSVASATSWHWNHHHKGGCNDSSQCDNPEAYSETFKTSDFSKKHFSNKYYASFESINEPTLKIESAYLTVSSNSNGWFDTAFAKDGYWYDLVGWLNADGTKTFELSSNFYDDILAGLDIKLWFSAWYEKPFWAELSVNGEYCPPVSEVPVPAALWLFGSGLVGFTALRRRKKTV
ncbi:hypothetical protein LCGC14_1272900 [marine sediment metagenome]|uniref:Ice-binding protein C-terminal domain-containing protein n=1 Tax=marine sediment metagenome TaxID=412755 RepID=A0A0F9LIQ2_9ZZZZ